MLVHGKGGAGVLVVYRKGDRVVAVVVGQGTESIDSRPRKKRERGRKLEKGTGEEQKGQEKRRGVERLAGNLFKRADLEVYFVQFLSAF